ncbi:hypothetical protein KIPB_002148 [Kipferlia bialata]|uniref:Kelch-type beta propeller n=1 Tax=Kipferlia bialata TaxID=797122 RepID=A0A391NJ71_9EUKA|nr:hypothetical protein KIPB_002148 [Kipferlia bialata]|eukprot:g2148.t1
MGPSFFLPPVPLSEGSRHVLHSSSKWLVSIGGDSMIETCWRHHPRVLTLLSDHTLSALDVHVPPALLPCLSSVTFHHGSELYVLGLRGGMHALSLDDWTWREVQYPASCRPPASPETQYSLFPQVGGRTLEVCCHFSLCGLFYIVIEHHPHCPLVTYTFNPESEGEGWACVPDALFPEMSVESVAVVGDRAYTPNRKWNSLLCFDAHTREWIPLYIQEETPGLLWGRTAKCVGVGRYVLVFCGKGYYAYDTISGYVLRCGDPHSWYQHQSYAMMCIIMFRPSCVLPHTKCEGAGEYRLHALKPIDIYTMYPYDCEGGWAEGIQVQGRLG